MSAPERFVLSTAERNSAAWRSVLAELKHKLDITRVKNEGDADQETTWKLRGRIGLLKELIRLDEPEPRPE